MLVLVGCSWPAAACAWGAIGHRVVGRIAEQLLDARSRRGLRALIGEQTLADAGLWLDAERDRLRHAHPGSERWHYENWPVCAAAAGGAPCADGNCASRAYAHYLAVLADRGAGREARAEALKIVVHVLADIHQPLHVADHDDRGGNQLSVLLSNGSRPRSLHAVWDTDFVKRALRGESEAAFAARLRAEHRDRRAAIEAGTLADWMRESHALARAYAYGRLPGFACAPLPAVLALPAEYVDGAVDIAGERLARAGIRLAAVLKTAH